jgi:hypothetical protein
MKKLLLFSAAMVLLWGCEKTLPDPADTKILDMSNSENIIDYTIKISDGNFVKADDQSDNLYFLPLGEVKGIGNIVTIPKKYDWVTQCAAVQGYGYIALVRGSSGYMQYYRIYVENQKNRFLVKYQTPFLGSETEILPPQTEFNFSANKGIFTFQFQNQSLFPYYCWNNEDWWYTSPATSTSSSYLGVSYGCYDGVTIFLQKNETSQPRDTTFLIKSPIGNDVSIKINQAGN